MNEAVTLDAFNMMCGKLIGEGAYRKVFECKLRPDLVVKVEDAEYRRFCNVLEMNVWNCASDAVRKWLAPCEFLSPDGRVLLQRRCEPVDRATLPDMLPAFMMDIKAENFGRYKGRLLMTDYAFTRAPHSTRLRKVYWDRPDLAYGD